MDGDEFGNGCKEQERLLQVCHPEKEGQRNCTLVMSKSSNLVTTDKEKAEVPQPSLVTSLPTPPTQMDCKMGTRGAKSLLW